MGSSGVGRCKIVGASRALGRRLRQGSGAQPLAGARAPGIFLKKNKPRTHLRASEIQISTKNQQYFRPILWPNNYKNVIKTTNFIDKMVCNVIVHPMFKNWSTM